MPVTFIKRECPRHRGCFTMGEKCDHCHQEDAEREIRRIVRESAEKFGALLREALS